MIPDPGSGPVAADGDQGGPPMLAALCPATDFCTYRRRARNVVDETERAQHAAVKERRRLSHGSGASGTARARHTGET
jgi:hypothetical protein